MIEAALGDLLEYAVRSGLIAADDVDYARNRVLEVLTIDTYDLAAEGTGREASIDDLLRPLLDDAVRRGLVAPDTVSRRDLLDTAVMGCFVPPPSVVQRQFWRDFADSPRTATDRFHAQAVASNYIRVTRTDRDIRWRHPSRYGDLDITINLSKPEKDPRDIAAAAAVADSGYPACLLCRENEGYAGRADHPSRQNLRLIAMELAGQPWFVQYSPYRYYQEHCIVLSEQHRPMVVDDAALERLAAFTALLPHYVVGSNADLPIVGGSILSHDHYQGGRYESPMDRAGVLWRQARDGVRIEVLDWPLAVVRLRGDDAGVLALAGRVLTAWREYADTDRGVLPRTAGVPHNTVTPIARREDGQLRLDMVLRNNRTSQEHPDGIFHPHAEIHPVKKENIGLIEVMGLAVLPRRLEGELHVVAEALLTGSDLAPGAAAHAPMLARLRAAGPVQDPQEALARTRAEAADMFVTGLEHCGVFGQDTVAGCQEFLATL